MQHPGQGYVIDVVSGRTRQGTGLAPSGHPAVHQGRIAVPAHLRSDAEPFRHSGPKTFDQGVRLLNDAEHGLNPERVLQIDPDRSLAPVHEIQRRPGDGRGKYGVGPVDPHHIRTEIGQHHSAERPWSY